MKTLAERIVSRREELGLRPVDLAHAAGVSISAVLQWETGSTKNLKNEHLFSIADALNLNPRWLAIGVGSKDASPSREAYRLALVQRDKAASDGGRRAWERIAASFAKAAVVVLGLTILPPSPAEASSHAVYYGKSRRRLVSLA